ncbi:MAG TPA: hypothetical protein VNZ06_01370 [Steroidobacteraceae bacterium]|nr:hypothetical protein [Steroidobacteraceae bacterium]
MDNDLSNLDGSSRAKKRIGKMLDSMVLRQLGGRTATRTLNWRKPLIRAAFALKNPGTLAELDLIQSIERSAPESIQAVQQARLEQLLHHAWSQTDYYREVLEQCGVVQDGRINLDRFENIPFLTKDIIRTQGDRLCARKLPRGRKAYSNLSGGSTGTPIRFMQDSGYWDVTIATRSYHFSFAGKELGEREMKIWGSERDILQGTLGLRASLENWLYNRKFEQCFKLPEQQIRKIIRDINTWQPKLLWCYRDGIDAVARYATEHDIELHSPAAILLGGATVYPFLAKQIERAFHCPVLSAYGSRELGAVACQCIRGQGHHIASQAHVLETINVAEEPMMEQDGELVVTPLLNYAMPMIRYRVGDRGRLTRRLCSCGRNFPLLESLTGRMIEVLINSKGEQVDPIYFMMLLSEVFANSPVRKSQVIQEKDRSITMNLALDKGATLNPSNPLLVAARKKVAAVMGTDCRVRFEFVADIALTASGKFPYVLRR